MHRSLEDYGSGWTARKTNAFLRFFVEIPLRFIPKKTLLWWRVDELHLVLCTRTDFERIFKAIPKICVG